MVGSHSRQRRPARRAGVAGQRSSGLGRKRRISKAIHLSPLYPFSLRRKFHTKDLPSYISLGLFTIPNPAKMENYNPFIKHQIDWDFDPKFGVGQRAVDRQDGAHTAADRWGPSNEGQSTVRFSPVRIDLEFTYFSTCRASS